MGPSWITARLRLAALLWCGAIVSCSGMNGTAESHYRGSLEVFLEPNDPQGVCSATIGLRNVSGARQGEAWLRLAWFDAAGKLLDDQRLRMDALEVNRYDAKNLAVPGNCDRVSRMRVTSAEWTLPQTGSSPDRTVVTIEGVERTEWAFHWDPKISLFAGVPQSG